MQNKIFDFTQINGLAENIQGKKVVLAGGSYDIMHYGHITFLKNARKEGDVLVIALESDEFSKNRKKKFPVHNQEQRAEILAALEMVDYILLLPLFTSHSGYYEMVKKIRPAVIAVTDGDPMLENKRKQAETVGGIVKIVSPRLAKFSSSKIVSYEHIFSD